MSDKIVIIEGSGKHCHVTQETLFKLFGEGFELENKKNLSQPGQFATPHKITIVGPKRSTEMSILGPCRAADQFELSMTDATFLGFNNVPVRESGDLKGSPGCKIIGPKGEADISEGVIIAMRHLHCTPEDAERFGIKDKQIIKLKVAGKRSLVLDEVLARVTPTSATYVHLDYDETNAAGLSGVDPTGEIIG